MLLTEYNEAEAMELFREEGRAEGLAEGRAEGLAEGRAEARMELTALHTASVMNRLGFTAEQALEALGVPLEDRSRVLEMLTSKD